MDHYQTLNVPRNASPEQIKKAYRKLSLETHPDVTKGCQITNAEKFKRISEAYSVLGSENTTRQYDFELKQRFIGFKRPRPQGGMTGMNNGASFASMLPRNVLIGSLLGITCVALLKTIMPKEQEVGDRNKTGEKRLVEAWKNPRTGRFEKPRPWDEEYRRLRPVLELVPRDQVYDRK
jgi:curved DNA-binding protein CbpA